MIFDSKLKIKGRMATIEHWYNLLREPYQSMARSNYLRYGSIRSYETNIESSLYNAIGKFSWSDSPEGNKFWRDMYEYFRFRTTLGECKTYARNFLSEIEEPWMYDKFAMSKFLHEKLNCKDEHRIKVLAYSKDPSIHMDYFIKLWKSDAERRNGLNSYEVEYKPNMKGIKLYSEQGMRILFRVVKPRGTSTVVSKELKNAGKFYEEHSN